jgi:hypothetical protein
MKLIVVIFFLPMLTLAASDHPLLGSKPAVSGYLNAFKSAAGESTASADKVLLFLDKLSSKKTSFKNEAFFLGHVFTKTHQRFLKQFKPYAHFDELLAEGNYNCLTGTALYALILEHLGFNYSIIETNYHIFMLVESSEGKILFEATDPLQGFVTRTDEIEKRIAAYKQNDLATANNGKTYYEYRVSLYKEITLDGLLGLMHYNLAVEAFNNHRLVTSVEHLSKAAGLYESPRIDEFARIILLSIQESQIEKSLKDSLLIKVRSIRDPENKIVASVQSF